MQIESIFFFFQAEDGIRDYKVTGVQTCALPILASVDQIELPWTSFPELINSIVRVLGYNVLGTNDLLRRTGGASPFENRNVTYTGLGAYDAVVNAGVGRFAGNTQAFNYLKAFYQPKGTLQTPVLTLHT